MNQYQVNLIGQYIHVKHTCMSWYIGLIILLRQVLSNAYTSNMHAIVT